MRIGPALLRAFAAVALVEGVTTIALFLVAMPLKYAAGWPHLIRPVGWAHGFAFLAYLALLVVAFAWNRVGLLGWLRAFLAGLIPFGTFVNARAVARMRAVAEARRGF